RREPVATGRTVVRAAHGQVRTPAGLAGLQVGSTELRAARAHRPAGRGDRGRRLRLSARAGVPAPLRAVVRRQLGRLHPGPAGLPRLVTRTVLPSAVLLLPVLLRGLPAVAQ